MATNGTVETSSLPPKTGARRRRIRRRPRDEVNGTAEAAEVEDSQDLAEEPAEEAKDPQPEDAPEVEEPDSEDDSSASAEPQEEPPVATRRARKKPGPKPGAKRGPRKKTRTLTDEDRQFLGDLLLEATQQDLSVQEYVETLRQKVAAYDAAAEMLQP